MSQLVISVIFLSLALAMDAFAVSISLGMGGTAYHRRDRYAIAITFGVFQALMFGLGFLAVDFFSQEFTTFNQFIAVILLSILGIKMIRDGFEEQVNDCAHESCQYATCQEDICLRTGKKRKLSLQMLLVFGIATSIDAFAAGLSFGLIYSQHAVGLFAMITIGAITFALALAGAFFGKKLETLIGNRANIIGGIILIILGIQSLF
ncbi:MAG: manganese efflux pump MntP family protein [Culicoidibacterales bacterium]